MVRSGQAAGAGPKGLGASCTGQGVGWGVDRLECDRLGRPERLGQGVHPAAGGEYGGGVGLGSPGRYCANKGLAPGLERSAAGCGGNKLGAL